MPLLFYYVCLSFYVFWGDLMLQNLSLSNDEIARLRSKDMKYSLHDKKLYLVLDLDHTLLNSTHLKKMTPDEKYLIARANSPKGMICLWGFLCLYFDIVTHYLRFQFLFYLNFFFYTYLFVASVFLLYCTSYILKFILAC